MLEDLPLRVEVVEHHVSIAAVAGCENDELEVASELVQESNRIGPDIDTCVDLLPVGHFDGEDDVAGSLRVFVAVNQSLVEVEHQSLLLSVLFPLEEVESPVLDLAVWRQLLVLQELYDLH